jgi:heat shock protein HtpX
MPVKVTIAPRRSVGLFALLAIVMVIASYVFVIVLAAACIYVPYWIIENAEHPPGQILLLLLGGVVIAGAMLWSLIPRRDRFEPPGPLLQRSSHPRLFAELDNIAASLNEPLPREVYLIGQVNAFVADRGGVLGFGSRRIMAIGLPLLSILNISEFRGVLAHEFAHYYSGDTKLGPFVYKTQSAMIRTFQNIGSIQELSRIAVISLLYAGVTFVLKHYFILFLRVINFVSRKKEYRADELACLVAGTEPFI